jgi:hypothetical protein
MSNEDVFACEVPTPDGPKVYFTLLPLETVFSRGLVGEAIVGGLLRPLKPEESITPEVFARNRVFVEFMHDVIARNGPSHPGLAAEAKKTGNGWVYILDARTPDPNGAVPPEDVIGAFQVKDGRVVANSYQRNQNHMIFSQRGFLRLDPGLRECLVRETLARYDDSPQDAKGGAGAG